MGSTEGVGLPDKVIFESTLKSSGQGGRAWPTARPGWRLRLAGWVSLSLGQAGLDSAPQFPRRAAGIECPVGFHSQTASLPRWGAGLGQSRKGSVSAKEVTSWLSQPPWGFPMEYLPSRQEGVPGSGACVFPWVPTPHFLCPSNSCCRSASLPNCPCSTPRLQRAKRDIIPSRPTCLSGHYGAANTALTLHQAGGHPVSPHSQLSSPLCRGGD